MLFRPLLVCFFLLLWLPIAALASGFPSLATLQSEGFQIGAEARLLPVGNDPSRILGSMSPARELSPASVTKVYTAAAVLDKFGPQHRFTTRLMSQAKPDANGVLIGDLVFDGGGDPGFTSEDLWRLAQRLHEAGVRQVDGRLIISQWRFGPVKCLTTDRCRVSERSDNAYSALLSSVGVNYGSWCVAVAPAEQAGQPARVVGCDSKVALPRIENSVTTQAANGGTELSARRVSDVNGDVLQVSGKISTNAYPRQLYRASSDPAAQTGELLLDMLTQSGISVRDGYAISTLQPVSGSHQLAAVDGKPLQEGLLRMLNYSNNFMADMMALNLVDSPRPDLAQAGAAVSAFAHSLPGQGPLRLDSGSGLTTTNRVTAAGTNVLLEGMFQRSSLFPSFVAGLQSPENGVMRFIRRGSPTFQNNVMIKTGTLSQPVTVRAMTGYFRTRTNRWGVFTVLVNGTASTPYLSWTRVVDSIAADLEPMINAN
ncbi:D-alanyl-D-alanine carboxypeptidase/D-alanyl-D-alanine endopeptidase [Halomonas halocynthiae]|uniref:D-alanyl-D-alanine carboxypeptidase/D-alanyl-D-alanine endopeptidase n=1 Tax=Halomonas halocynthiae TaxID=176290 RepID=UPI000417DE03|nr:D-alanyl-D-alanine carboxypeptidase/D-alanyl-D-alanine-endopeptidase [Halomonas halocynthiae]